MANTNQQLMGLPNQDDEKADAGQIHISVSHRLPANLDKADGRDEHAEKPKPTGEKEGS